MTIKIHETRCQTQSQLPDYVVHTGKIGGILVPSNVKLLRFGNERSTAAVTPWKQTSGTEIRDSWDANV